MHLFPPRFSPVAVRKQGSISVLKTGRQALVLLSTLLLFAAEISLRAQVPNRITSGVDTTRVGVLANHHPLWANAGNDLGLAPASQEMGPLTLVLARSPEQEQALAQLTADQQNPASPAFHHWLTPAEVGARFGLSDEDIATITGWLEAEGLHVNWVSPSRIFIQFTGTAGNVGQAFGTEIHNYTVRGEQRVSVASDPTIPQALAPVIKAVRELYTIEDRPMHHMATAESSAPQVTLTDGSTTSYFIGPADFNTIYDVPTTWTGTGETVGIVAESRTDMADFTNFKAQTGATFANPTEVVPTAFGGVDPGPAYTSPPSGGDSVIQNQGEATLDVIRVGSVAPAANLQLIVSSTASGGIATDAQYLVETTPVPTSVMSISFGECESEAGSSGVAFWDQLFQQAAAEGISVFVASGDSGASGCDTAFATPPSSPGGTSPNAICSSSYATCVGGTEFNDTTDPSQYWSSTNGAGLLSALGYIPEGGWNEPETTSGATQVSSSGGGVSSYITTPSWQTGTGVPPARAGRYTPDVSFSASCHDGYIGCFAAGGGSCVAGASGTLDAIFCGTSAAAPGMAGVAALLDQKQHGAQGNLNPWIYQQAATASAPFHDVTVATSGVTSCSVNTPSMCNNSIPGPTSLTGGQAGYLVTAGYDEVTGLGSLDVGKFLNSYTGTIVPTITVSPSSSSVSTTQALTVTVTVSGGSGNPTPTGSVTVTSGSYTSSPATLASGSASISISAGSLVVGNDTLTASYTPDSNSSATYADATSSQSVTVTNPSNATPTVTVTPSTSQITTGQGLTVTVAVAGASGNPTPTGTVTLTGGGYTSTVATLASGSASITIPAGSLAVGADTLTAAYNPDSASTSVYNPATGTGMVTVIAKITPAVSVTATPSSITTAQSTTVTVTVAGSGGYATPTGLVTVAGGGYTSPATTLTNGSASITIPAGSLVAAQDTLTAIYTPDSTSSPIYNSATGTTTVTVTAAPTPGFTISGTSVSLAPGATSNNTSTITVTPTNGFTGNVTLTAVVTSPSGAQDPPTFTFSPSSVTISGTGASTSTLTISTTAPTTGAVSRPETPLFRKYGAGGAALACVLLLCLPTRRRNWRKLLGLVALVAGMVGVQSCTSNGSGPSTGGNNPPSKTTPAVTVTPTPASVTTAQGLTVAVSVSGGTGNPTPTGSVSLASGTYSAATPATLSNGSTTFTIPANTLPAGTDPLNAAYTPDTVSATVYNGASGSGSVTVTSANNNPGTTAGNYTITVTGTSGSTTATGMVTLTVQ
jgi:subtilase family serine protease